MPVPRDRVEAYLAEPSAWLTPGRLVDAGGELMRGIALGSGMAERRGHTIFIRARLRAFGQTVAGMDNRHGPVLVA